MLDGTYDLTVNIPFNKIKGTATLTATSATTLDATVEGMGLSQTVSGTCDGDAFCFEGELPTPIGTMSYTLTGRVDGDAIAAECATKMGTFKATGTRR